MKINFRPARRNAAKITLGGLALAVAIPTTALASHVFADVDDAAFYAAPVEWAFDNDITTGKTATSFAPLDNVTRGESVTFLKRYDDNIVQPALAALPTMYHAAVDTDGSLGTVTSEGVTATRVAKGVYEVQFGVAVHGCIWSATLVDIPSGIILGQPSAPDGSIGLARDFDGVFPGGSLDAEGIYVETTDPAAPTTTARFI